MNKGMGYRRLAWGMALFEIVLLTIMAIMLFLAPDHSSENWLFVQVRAIVALGAPILGLLIVTKQPHNRIGWLWMAYGLITIFLLAGSAIYYLGGSQPAGYSALEYFLLWSSEAANLAALVCMPLLLLWFPNGQLVSRRWRIIYFWLFLAIIGLGHRFFVAGPDWNGGAASGGIVINNPYGFLPDHPISETITAVSFFSLVLIIILAAVSLVIRYRSSDQLVRLQLRWFVFSGFLYVFLDFFPVFFLGGIQNPTNFTRLLDVIGFSAIVPLYIATGIAVLRYRLYEIDVVIRKTLVYTVLTGLLALIYFGTVLLLQSVFESFSGKQSPIAIVISTLVIAALFGTLRLRVQAFIDRRFYRRKYDAQQVLAHFAQSTRDEVSLELLTDELTRAVQESVQPESAAIWLKDKPV